jgi:NAD(P)-dependent dehydrogenase (short-subunit alcohol dehydrogenase family)
MTTHNGDSARTNALNAFGLEGKVAVITGAASGIGKATAKLFAATGAKVVIADLNPDGARAVAEEIVAGGGTATGIACDVGVEADIKHLFAETAQKHGGVDVLVNNAAYRPKADFMEMSAEEWDRMHVINTRGTFLCMREAIRLMKAAGKGGAIVNISTIGTQHPTIFANTHYDSSKGGVNALTKTSAIEFAPDKIRVNAVLPGGTDTEGSRQIRASGFAAKGPITIPGRLPMARLAEPIELANAILFLASPASSYITGHLLPVDGGYLVS